MSILSIPHTPFCPCSNSESHTECYISCCCASKSSFHIQVHITRYIKFPVSLSHPTSSSPPTCLITIIAIAGLAPPYYVVLYCESYSGWVVSSSSTPSSLVKRYVCSTVVEWSTWYIANLLGRNHFGSHAPQNGKLIWRLMYCKSIRGLLYLCVEEEECISTSRDTIEMIGGDGSLVGGIGGNWRRGWGRCLCLSAIYYWLAVKDSD